MVDLALGFALVGVLGRGEEGELAGGQRHHPTASGRARRASVEPEHVVPEALAPARSVHIARVVPIAVAVGGEDQPLDPGAGEASAPPDTEGGHRVPAHAKDIQALLVVARGSDLPEAALARSVEAHVVEAAGLRAVLRRKTIRAP